MIPTISLDKIDQLQGSTSEIQRLYLVRHGQSQLNLADADGVARVQGTSLQVPLTEQGQNQAQALLEKLKSKIQHLDLELISSNALRATQTIAVFSKYLNKDVKTYPGLRELGSGEWEGKRKEEEYKQAYKLWQDLSAKDKFHAPKMPGGESPQEVAVRSMNDLTKAIEASKGKTILGICHDMTSNVIYMHLNKVALSEEKGKDLPYINIGNCDILQIEVPAGKSIQEGKVTALIKA